MFRIVMTKAEPGQVNLEKLEAMIEEDINAEIDKIIKEASDMFKEE